MHRVCAEHCRKMCDRRTAALKALTTWEGVIQEHEKDSHTLRPTLCLLEKSLEAFPIRVKDKTKIGHTTAFDIVLKDLANAVRQEK